MTDSDFKEARRNLGLTQRQTATILDTKLSTLQKWETGVNRVPGAAWAAIALCFKYKGAIKYLLAKYS